MQARILGKLVAALALGGAGLVVSATACNQPSPPCATARGDFAVKYTLTGSATPADGACGKKLGDTVTLQFYNQNTSGNKPDYKNTTVAIETLELSNAADTAGGDPDATHKLYGYGHFSSGDPDGQNFCYVPSFDAAQQNLPDVPATPDTDAGPGTPEVPALNASVVWNNFKVYVTAAYTGTMFSADVTFNENDCKATYHAVGLFPAVACTTDDDCNPNAEPDKGRVTGSGINPDLRIKCAADLGLCVLDGEPPAFH